LARWAEGKLNPFIAIPLTAFFTSIVITTFVFAQNHRTPVNRAFILLSILFTLWVGIDVIVWSPIDRAWIVPVMKVQAIVYNFIGFAFVNFAYTFIARARDRQYYFFATMPLVATIVIVGTDLIISGYRQVYWGNAISGGPWFLSFALVNGGIPILYAVVLLVRNMRSKESPAERTRLKLFLIGTTFGLVTGFPSFLLHTGTPGIALVPIYPLCLIAFLLSVYFAVTRYRFLAISVGDAASELFSSTNNGVVILNMSDGIVQHNPAARELLATDRNGSIEDSINYIARCFREDNRQDDNELSWRNESSGKYLSVNRNPISHSSQQIGTLLFINDISAQKKTEEQIVASNRELGEARDQALQANRTKSAFLANMSHELRTPLSAIIGYSELLQESARFSKETDHKDDLNRIHNAGHQLLGLINDILDLSKIEAGKMELFVEEFNIRSVVKEAEANIKEQVKENDNLLIVHCPTDIGSIASDRVRLLQVLSNLLSNAAKFTEGGKITLDVNRQSSGGEETIEFKITDTGIGMSQQQQMNLFQYFTQADPSVTRKYGGSGLGLAISQQFSRMMGGKISARSQLDTGSEFIVKLPAKVIAKKENASQITD